jgi:hypothetical protein
MKCVYRFPVRWIVQVEGIQPFLHEGWQYDFISENGRIKQIQVTVPVRESDQLPELVPNLQVKNTLNLITNEPSCSELLMKTLRTLEGFLSIYGLEKIALEDTEITWIPETDEEKRQLKVTHFSFIFSKPASINLRAPFSVISRSIVASKRTLDWDIPLSFFRKGRNDFWERRYIDAIYNFYFLLETLFGNGKTKNAQIAAEFKKSKELITFVSIVLKEGEQGLLRRGGRSSLLAVFRKTYSNKSPEQFLEAIVELRGFLHHHTVHNKRIWHPAKEYDYEVDALLLQDLCFKICSARVESLISADKQT